MADGYEDPIILFHETVKNLKKNGWTVKKDAETAATLSGVVGPLVVGIAFTALFGPIGLMLSLLMIKYLIMPVEVEVFLSGNNRIWITGGIGDILVTSPEQVYPRVFFQDKKSFTLYTLLLGTFSSSSCALILFAP